MSLISLATSVLLQYELDFREVYQPKTNCLNTTNPFSESGLLETSVLKESKFKQ